MKASRYASGGFFQVLSVQMYQFECAFVSCLAESWNQG